jgi:hypothetical protein
LLLFVDLLGFVSKKCGASPLSTAAAVDGGFNPFGLKIDTFYSYLIGQLIVCFGFVDAAFNPGAGDPAGCSFDLVV